MSTSIAVGAIYGIGALATFGTFSRAGPVGIKQIVCTGLWPIWWSRTLGLKGILDAIGGALGTILNAIGRTLDEILTAIVKVLSAVVDGIDTISYGTEGRRIISLGLGLFACGHFLSSNLNACSGAACAGIAIESAAMLFSPVNIGYLTWLISQYAVG